MGFVSQLRRVVRREQENDGTRPGYYLVKGGARYFISESVNPAALDRVADRVLSDRAGWNYWIDYLHGPDINRTPHWSNVDQSDRFI